MRSSSSSSLADQWRLDAARHFRAPTRTVRDLHKRGILPPYTVRNPAVSYLYYDEPAILALEQVRPHFDTPLEPFLIELECHVDELLSPNFGHGLGEVLCEFRNHSFGRLDAFYPINRAANPWRGHRIAITRAELDAAGYPAFAKLFRGADRDVYRSVEVGGEVPLYPFDDYGNFHRRPGLRKPRAEFLTRLAEVLEARS